MGEGSGAEGDLFQVSNERTLGMPEEEILSLVEQAISTIVEMELLERARMRAEGGIPLKDRAARAYGILTHCCTLGEGEFMRYVSDLKLGLALGYFCDDEPCETRPSDWTETKMWQLDELSVAMRPAGVRSLGAPDADEDVIRAENVSKVIRGMRLELI